MPQCKKQNYANQASILTAARKDALLQGMGVSSLAGGDMLAFSQNYDRYFPYVLDKYKNCSA